MSPLLTAKQVAPLLNVSEAGVYRLARENQIPHVHVGTKYIRFSQDAIEKWVARNPEYGDLAQVTESRNESANCVVAQVMPRWVPTQHADMESAKRAAEERLQKMCEEIIAGLEGMREGQAK